MRELWCRPCRCSWHYSFDAHPPQVQRAGRHHPTSLLHASVRALPGLRAEARAGLAPRGSQATQRRPRAHAAAGHQPARRHQRGHRGRPVVRQVAAAQVRGGLPAARGLHLRPLILRRRPHRLGRQGARPRGSGACTRSGGLASACVPRRGCAANTVRCPGRFQTIAWRHEAPLDA